MPVVSKYITKLNQHISATAQLSSAKLDLIKYILESGYDKVLSRGYTLSIKKSKRQKIKTNVEIDSLQTLLDDRRSKLQRDNREEIYDLQKRHHEICLDLHNLVNNSETAELERLIESAKVDLKESEAASYDLVSKFDVKSSNISDYISDVELQKLIVEGKKLEPRITKGSVIKFVIAWSYTQENLEDAWAQFIQLNKSS